MPASALQLRLITPESWLYTATDREMPAHWFGLPWWGFLWPGGYAVAQYLADNPAVAAGRRVLDFAAGCGVGGIVAAQAGAAEVICNDICPMACTASVVNAELNNVRTGGEWLWKQQQHGGDKGDNGDTGTAAAATATATAGSNMPTRGAATPVAVRTSVGDGHGDGGGGPGGGGTLWWLSDDLLAPALHGPLSGPRSCIRPGDLVIVGDAMYDITIANLLLPWLRELASEGAL